MRNEGVGVRRTWKSRQPVHLHIARVCSAKPITALQNGPFARAREVLSPKLSRAKQTKGGAKLKFATLVATGASDWSANSIKICWIGHLLFLKLD
jgi:hypothetical protein